MCKAQLPYVKMPVVKKWSRGCSIGEALQPCKDMNHLRQKVIFRDGYI